MKLGPKPGDHEQSKILRGIVVLSSFTPKIKISFLPLYDGPPPVNQCLFYCSLVSELFHFLIQSPPLHTALHSASAFPQ